jgi:hypothetical protein
MPDNANDVQAILADYRYVLSMQVRFADLDVLGHLNNAKYVTYMEQVRVQYFIDVCAWHGKWEEFGMILARTEIDYALPHLLWRYCECLCAYQSAWWQELRLSLCDYAPTLSRGRTPHRRPSQNRHGSV